MRQLRYKHYFTLIFSLIVILVAYHYVKYGFVPTGNVSIISLDGGGEISFHGELLVGDAGRLENETVEIGFFKVENGLGETITIENITFLPKSSGIRFSTYRAKIPPRTSSMVRVVVRAYSLGKYSFDRVRVCYRAGENLGCVETPINLTLVVREKIGIKSLNVGLFLKLYLNFTNYSIIPREASREYIRVCNGSVIAINYTLVNIGSSNIVIKELIYNYSEGVERGSSIYTSVIYPYNGSIPYYTGFLKQYVRFVKPGTYYIYPPKIVYSYMDETYVVDEKISVKTDVVVCSNQ